MIIPHALCKSSWSNMLTCVLFSVCKGGDIAGKNWENGCLKCWKEDNKLCFEKSTKPTPVSNVLHVVFFCAYVRTLWDFSSHSLKPDTWYIHILRVTNCTFENISNGSNLCWSSKKGKSHVLVKVISRCQRFRNGLWNVNKREKKKANRT